MCKYKTLFIDKLTGPRLEYSLSPLCNLVIAEKKWPPPFVSL